MLHLLAQVSEAPPPPPIVNLFIPWIVMGTILGIIMATIAPRKGRSPVLWFFAGYIPLVGFFMAILLASRPDVELLERLRLLEDKLASVLPPSEPPALRPQT